jgi:50S ribosomal protein L16 3-hydroxylase
MRVGLPAHIMHRLAARWQASARMARLQWPMAIQDISRKSLPIEVRGNAKHPLGMSSSQFLRDYWQKRPLLIRNAFAGFQPPLEANDLAGLACEEVALSRLIVHDEKRDRWTVRSGPFAEEDFARTPKSHWTLLVQDVDKWDADVAALLDHFTFLPSWRVDDVMVSYAEDGGGVGAHVDQYDVFLLQGEGQRHWAISTDADAPLDFRNDVELKQLSHFEPTHEWLLEPGDMLYLPPGVPHDGVAIGNCMTFSIGMRAPSQAELTGDLADFLAERMPDELRYADPDLAPARNAGEIDLAALNRLRQALPFAAQLDRSLLADWFGRFITRYRSAQVPAAPPKPRTEAALLKSLDGGARLVRHPWARLAWVRERQGATLYVSGQAYESPLELAGRLCAERELGFARAPSKAERAVLLGLVNDGHLMVGKGMAGRRR